MTGGVLAACPALTQRQAAGGTHGRPEAVHLRVLLVVRLPHHLALHDLLTFEARQLGHSCGVAWPGLPGWVYGGQQRAQDAERLSVVRTNDSVRLSQLWRRLWDIRLGHTHKQASPRPQKATPPEATPSAVTLRGTALANGALAAKKSSRLRRRGENGPRPHLL